MGPADTGKCESDLRVFLDLCKLIGVPIKHEKTVSATNCIIFMGLEIDSVQLEARLPEDKLNKIRDLLAFFKSRRKIKLRELQSLIGLLNFCCKVVLPGRAFLRRLIDLTRNVVKPFHRITLSREARRDLAAWHLFIDNFNGKHIFLDQKWLTNEAIHLYTDASGALGYGAILATHWFYGSWPAQITDTNITYKELFPITLSLEIWGDNLTNKCIILHSDNQAVVHIINKQSSKDSKIMGLVRRLVIACMKHNILVRSEHVPGKENNLADMLSRFQIEDFRQNAPWADTLATHVPKALLDYL
jgi:ribonuclease HI